MGGRKLIRHLFAIHVWLTAGRLLSRQRFLLRSQCAGYVHVHIQNFSTFSYRQLADEHQKPILRKCSTLHAILMETVFTFKEFQIELLDLSVEIDAYNEIPQKYDFIYTSEEDQRFSIRGRHLVRVILNGNPYRSALVTDSGTGLSIEKDSYLVDGDNLIIRCGNNVFSLALPSLEMNWVLKVDFAACFSIYKYQDSYITHGEISISRISQAGVILWEYSGADIFVNIEDPGDVFKMHEDFIELMDFNGSKYKIDYKGKTINYEESKRYFNLPLIKFIENPKKAWWKFW